MRLVDEVERAKVAFSRLTGGGIDVWRPLTRSQFESL